MPPPAIPQRTLGQVYLDIARRSGCWYNDGIATAGTGTTLTDAVTEQTPVANANVVTGEFLYIYAGTSVDTAKEINAYGTLGIMGWTGSVTSPDATSKWVATSVRPSTILGHIDNVTREWIYALPIYYESEALVVDSLLSPYGAFEEWAAGTALAPDGWVLGGAGAAIAQETGVITHGRFSAKLTGGGGATGTLTYTVPQYLLRNLGGLSVSLWGFIAENAVGDCSVVVSATDSAGVVTTSTWAGTYTGNRWQRLQPDISTKSFALPNPVTALTVQVQAVASAVVYAADLALISPYRMQHFDLPASAIGIQNGTLYLESGDGATDYASAHYGLALVYGQGWDKVPRDSTGTQARTIRLRTLLPAGRHLRATMVRAQAVVSGAATNVEMNPEILVALAARRVLEGMPVGTDRTQRLAELDARELSLYQRFPVLKKGPVRTTGIEWLDSR